MAPQPQVEEAHSRRGDEPGTAPGIGGFGPTSRVSEPSPCCWWSSTTEDSRDQWWLHRCRRLLRDLGVCHHRTVAEGASVRGGTSLVHFYGRRSRRIVPAATVVIIATVVAHLCQGRSLGTQTADDGQLDGGLSGQLPLCLVGTNYLIGPAPFIAAQISGPWPSRSSSTWSIPLFLPSPLRCRGPSGPGSCSACSRRFVSFMLSVLQTSRSHRCVLLPVHPGLGARDRGLGRGGDGVAAEDPQGRRPP